eukprot:280090-Prorocentrum_lima.AAC.1
MTSTWCTSITATVQWMRQQTWRKRGARTHIWKKLRMALGMVLSVLVRSARFGFYLKVGALVKTG